VSLIAAVFILVAAHIFLSRSRPGWHITAIGGSRRSAFNTGIDVRKTVFRTYVISGACCGIAGFLFGARLNGTGPGTGIKRFAYCRGRVMSAACLCESHRESAGPRAVGVCMTGGSS